MYSHSQLRVDLHAEDKARVDASAITAVMQHALQAQRRLQEEPTSRYVELLSRLLRHLPSDRWGDVFSKLTIEPLPLPLHFARHAAG